MNLKLNDCCLSFKNCEQKGHETLGNSYFPSDVHNSSRLKALP